MAARKYDWQNSDMGNQLGARVGAAIKQNTGRDATDDEIWNQHLNWDKAPDANFQNAIFGNISNSDEAKAYRTRPVTPTTPTAPSTPPAPAPPGGSPAPAPATGSPVSANGTIPPMPAAASAPPPARPAATNLGGMDLSGNVNPNASRAPGMQLPPWASGGQQQQVGLPQKPQFGQSYQGPAMEFNGGANMPMNPNATGMAIDPMTGQATGQQLPDSHAGPGGTTYGNDVGQPLTQNPTMAMGQQPGQPQGGPQAGGGYGYETDPQTLQQNSLMNAIMQNPETMNPNVVAQLKEAQKEQALLMQQQAGQGFSQSAAARGVLGGGNAQGQQQTAQNNAFNSILSGNRSTDIAAAQTNRADQLNALNASSGLQKSQLDNILAGHAAQLGDTQFNAAQDQQHYQNGINQQLAQFGINQGVAQNAQQNYGADLGAHFGGQNSIMDVMRFLQQGHQFDQSMGFNYNQLDQNGQNSLLQFLMGMNK